MSDCQLKVAELDRTSIRNVTKLVPNLFAKKSM